MKRMIILLLTPLLLAACTLEDKNVEVKEKTAKKIEQDVEQEKEKEETPPSKEPDDNRLHFGETAEIDGIKVTINDANFTKERIPDHFETFEYVVKLDVTYENTTDTLFPAGRDIILKANGEDTTYYDMEDILLTDVPAHDSVTGVLYFAFNGQPKELTAIFEPLLNTDGESAEFDVMPK